MNDIMLKEGGKRPLRRARHGQEASQVRRQDLLAVTVSCLARLGPRGATGREICRQAGVSHGLLRHYFANPDNMLLETYEQLCERFISHVEKELRQDEHDPWAILDRFFEIVFSDEWAGADIIGAWMAFWQLVRSREDFAAVSERFNLRQRALLEQIVSRLPTTGYAMPMADGLAILSAVLDGLWVDFYLSPARTSRERVVQLCRQAARLLFAS